jgi:hypothetical protein
MKHRSVLLITVLVVLTSSRSFGDDVLQTAKSLAMTRFQGWKYGSNRAEKQIDCVQFVLAVVEDELRHSLDRKSRDQILIANLSAKERVKLEELIADESNKIRGVQHALVASGRGEKIAPADARSGDIVQYWIMKSNGTWFGHAGILESVNEANGVYRARIFGAHASANGIATSSFSLRLNGPNRKVFIVRLKK